MSTNRDSDTAPAPLRVGLTGGAGAGKSELARHLAEHGITVIDSDQLAREVVRPGQPGLQRLVDRLGSGILDASGGLDREALRERMLHDPRLRNTVEECLHPPILERMEARIASVDSPYVVVEVPLLVESGLEDRFDRIVTVEAPEEDRVRRLVERDRVDMAQAERLIGVQATESERVAAADHVVRNMGDIEALEQAALKLHDELTTLANKG